MNAPEMYGAEMLAIETHLAAGRRHAPFIARPESMWVAVERDGWYAMSEYATRSMARFWQAGSITADARLVKAQVTQWYGQPMRVKGGPIIKRVWEMSKYPAGTVYTIGRGRQQFDAQITEVSHIGQRVFVNQVLFKGVLWPFRHGTAQRKTRR